MNKIASSKWSMDHFDLFEIKTLASSKMKKPQLYMIANLDRHSRNQLLLRDGEVIVPSNQLRRVSMLLKKGSILAGLNSGPYERQSSFPGPFKRCFICNLDVIGCKFYLAEYVVVKRIASKIVNDILYIEM